MTTAWDKAGGGVRQTARVTPDLDAHPGVRRVRAALAAAGHDDAVRALDDSARTAAQAAASLGVQVTQIANSLVFAAVGRDGARFPVLVMSPGGRKVDTTVIAGLLDVSRVEQADPDLVRAATGYAIGGVSPVGHPAPLPALVEETLAEHEVVWAAAGHPHAVFATTHAGLVRLTGGRSAAVVAPA